MAIFIAVSFTIYHWVTFLKNDDDTFALYLTKKNNNEAIKIHLNLTFVQCNFKYRAGNLAHKEFCLRFAG